MLEQERIIVEPCGCRIDKMTGLRLCYCARHDHDRSEHLALATEPPALGQPWEALRLIADAEGASGRYALLRFGGRRTDRWRLVPIRASDNRVCADVAFGFCKRDVRQGAVALLDPSGVLLAWYSSPRLRSLW